MWQSLTKLSVPGYELVIRGAVVFIFVLLLLRLSGKRQIGQMSPIEFVAVLLISNAVQNAMNGGDNSLLGGLLLAMVLIFISWVISMLTFRNRRMRHLFEGVPTVVIHKGMLIDKNLAKERMPHNELRAMLRKQGIHDIKDINTAILESDGTLSVTKNSELTGMSTSHQT